MEQILNLKFDYVDRDAPLKKTEKKKTKKAKVIPPPQWTKSNKLNTTLNEVAFSNWSAGGENSISMLNKATFVRKYEDQYMQWNNEMVLKYGLNLQEGQKVRKADDAININSTFGYRKDSLSYWFYSAKMTFNTQFANGYNYPDRDNPISRLMAPGYLFVGLGMEYSDTPEQLTAYFSPATYKATFVLDQRLANAGSFGVTGAKYDMNGDIIEEGKKYMGEFGILVSGSWEKQLYENMTMNNKVSFYTDYVNSFGNIDVDWEMSIDLTVNKFVKANIGTHIKYDDDVKFVEAEDEYGNDASYGARMQLKQLLGVGLSYSF
ncbi:DUF3078 domain-containing protein [Neptunitalea lumnitzerae]|uniref:DUF3078 domain-containing protein n=1 Tax=Neptunitalea lumnitzerae TaxID=2965509 RepID=A0ABQ5MH77_9FLAO|nr:DUF3078 domain-containing protein [Neptunitalea sp. Y10]GLB48766.1 hypothetical protein Y10_11340 [Neptunitalea sp. Y10]